MRAKRMCLGIVILALGPGAVDAQIAGTDADRARRDLARQERRVAPQSASKTLEREQVEAAIEFARKIAGSDDARFVKVFRSAMNLAVALDTEAFSVHPGPRGYYSATASLSPQSIFSDERYIRNAKKLIAQRIIGGSATVEFPDCVAIGSPGGWCCTGTLVARNVVVTAGHCDGVCADRVFVGPNVGASGEIVQVSRGIRHPKYGDGGHHDLTVLILEREITTVLPRSIAPGDAIDSATSVRVVGYGNTDVWSSGGYGIRRMVDVPIASPSCSSADAQSRYGCDEGLELVAGAPFLDLDSCNGDSGGPVYVEHDGGWHLAGATSRATNEALRPCGDGGIYVRLDKYADWIRSVPGGHWK